MEDPLTLPPPAASRPGVPRRLPALLAVAALCVAAVFLYGRYAGGVITSESGRVEGRTLEVPAAASGRVTAVPVTEGQEVRRGQLLLTLDDEPLRAALAEARAALETARSGGSPSPASHPALREAEAAAQAAADRSREEEDAARRSLEHWTAEHARTMVMLRSPASTTGEAREQAAEQEVRMRAAMRDARRAMEEAGRRRAAADAEWRRVRESSRQERPGPELVALWESRVARAERDLAGSSVFAPFDGRVIWIAARPGQDVARGEPLLTLTPLAGGGEENLWVTASFGRRQMLELHVGQECRVRLEDGGTLNGIVTALLPDERGGLARITLIDAGTSAYPGQGATVSVRVK